MFRLKKNSCIGTISFSFSGFGRIRAKLAGFLQNKIFEWISLGLTILYATLVLGFLAFEDGAFQSNKVVEWIVESFELCILSYFVLDTAF